MSPKSNKSPNLVTILPSKGVDVIDLNRSTDFFVNKHLFILNFAKRRRKSRLKGPGMAS